MQATEINFVAVVVAAMAGFVVGGLWYSPMVVGKVWMKATGITEEQIANGDKRKIFGLSFIALLIMSYCLAVFIASSSDPLMAEGFFSAAQQGACSGVLVGLGLISFAFVVVGLFEFRSWQYIAVNAGYWVVTMALMGAIVGGWR